MKKINLIEMLQGCSKRNGTTFRQSNPDGQPTVNRQSRLMLRQGYLRNLAMLFAVLVMSIANIGMAWGAVTYHSIVPNIDKTNYETYYLYSNGAATSSTNVVGTAFSSSKLTYTTACSSWVEGNPAGKDNSDSPGDFSAQGFYKTDAGDLKYNGTSMTFHVTNCVGVALLGKGNSNTKPLQISVKEKDSSSEIGSVASTTGNSVMVLTYGTTLNASKKYDITITSVSGGNSYAYQIRFEAPDGGGSTYSITYHCNDATSGCPATNPATGQTALPSPLPSVTKTNYTFGGWYTDAALSSAASAGDKLSDNADLYAKWTQTITLDREGATTGSTSVTATYNSATLPSITNPTKDGYTFEGWYIGDNGTGTLVINTSGALQANVSGYTGADGIWTSATARTLYAKWTEAPCFSATINKNSSSYSVSGNSSKDITSDATVTSGGAISCVNYNASSKSFSFSANGVSPATSDGYVQFTLPSGSALTTGSVIRVQGYADNADGGLLLIDDAGTTVASQKNNGVLDFSYTVTAGSAINGLDHIRLKRARTSGTNAVKTVTVTGCGDAPSCTAPTSPSITPSNGWLYVPGEEITLTASASNTDASTTYTWYRGATLEAAKAAGAIQAAKTSTQGGTTYTIASCTASDAYKYWCEISNGTGCEASASYDIKLYTFFLYNNDHSNNNSYAFTSIDRTNKKLSVTFDVSNATYTYYFKVSDGLGTWYGKNSYTITSATNYCDGLNSSGANVGLTTTLVGSYTVDYYYQSNNVVVTYPVPNQTAGQTVYFDNTLTQMSNMYIRIGSTTHSSASSAFTAVPGTAALYQGSTIAWDGFAAWSIADNTGWTNTNSIYQPWNGQWTSTGNDYQMSKQTDYQNYVVSGAVTIVPTALHNSEYNCQYYNVDKYNGMLRDRVTITAPTNGTITVNYTSEENVPSSFSATTVDINQDLAHTVIITPTATPAEGYTLSGLTVNGVAHTSGTTYTVTANTTIAATFSPASYTVTLNTNDGTINAGNVTSYTYGTGATLPTDVTKSGFTFGGWYDNSDLTGSAVTTISTTATGNKEYWAKWTAAAVLTALECNTLYKVEQMVPASITLSGTEQYAAGLSSNARFEVIGDPAQTDGAAGTPGMKNEAAEFASQSFAARMYLKGASNTTGSGTTFVPTSRAVKFIVGEAGTLDIYAHRVDRLYLKKAGDSGTTQLGTSTSGSGSKVSHSVTAGTYYIYATNNSTCIYGIQLNCCTTPAAPTAFSAGSITSTGATFSIIDAGDAASYDIYYSISSSEPDAGTAATTTSTEKTKAVTGLTANTTYYAWVRSVCDADHKSAWVALTSPTAKFTTSAAAALNDGCWDPANTAADKLKSGDVSLTPFESNFSGVAGITSVTIESKGTGNGQSAGSDDDSGYLKIKNASTTKIITIVTTAAKDITIGGEQYSTNTGSFYLVKSSAESTKLAESNTGATSKATNCPAGTYYVYAKASTKSINFSLLCIEDAASDVTAPTFESSVPANGATDVATSGTIVLTFNEPLGSVDQSKFTLTGATKGAVAIDGSDATKVNIAYSGAANSATVTLATAAAAVSDVAGNALAAELSNISFTTAAAAPAGDCITIAYFETTAHNNSSSKPDNAGKYIYGYTNSAKTEAYAYTITSSTGDNKGQGTGESDYLRMNYGTTVTIYADNTTTGGTPASFSNVTSVSVDFKMKSSSYYTTFDIYVGGTKIANNVSLEGAAQSAFTTFTYDNLEQLSGTVRIVNKGSGSSNYHFYVDNIEICTSSLPACTTPVIPTLTAKTVCEGGDADAAWNATITNSGSLVTGETVAYSWVKKGGSTPVSSVATYQPTDVTEAMAGTYVVTATVSADSKASSTATKEVTLTVNEATEVTAITADKATVYPTNSVTLTATANMDATWQWYTCTNAEGAGESSLGGATSASYTIASAGAAGTYYYKAEATGSCGTAERVYTLTVTAASECEKYFWFVYAADATTNGVVNNRDGFFTGAPTGSSNSSTYKFTLDGTEYKATKNTGSGSFSISFTIPEGSTATMGINCKGSSSKPLYLTHSSGTPQKLVSNSSSNASCTVENITEGTWTLTSAGSWTLAALGVQVCTTSSCTDATPTITAANTTVCVGSELSITATGYETSPESIQWQKLNGSAWDNISGATAATYTVAEATAADAGSYRVVVTKGCARTSNTVTISVPSAPNFGSTVPASVSVMQTIALSINTVEATDAVKYKWYKSADATWDAGDTEIGTNKELIKAYDGEATGSPSYYIFCRAQNACGITTSTAIAVNVTAYVEEDCATKGNEGDAEFDFTKESGVGESSVSNQSCWTSGGKAKYLTYTAPDGKYFDNAKVTVAVSSGSVAAYGYSTDGSSYTYANLTGLSSALAEKTIDLPANVTHFRIGRNFDPDYGVKSGTFYLRQVCFEYTDACTATTITVSPSSVDYEMGDEWSNPTFTLSVAGTLTYSSSNEDIASVDDDGTVTFNGDAGTVTITASYAGDGTYCASEGSYTITVSCPGGAPKVVASGTTVDCSSSITLQAKKQDGTAFADGTYQWFRNGEEIDGATSSSYTATQAGTYTVARTNTSGCTTPSTNSAIVTSETTEPEVERLVPFQYYHVDKTYTDQMKMRHLFAVKNSGTLDGKHFKMYVSCNGGAATDVTSSNALVVVPNGDGHVDTVMVDLNKLSGKYNENDELVFTCKAIDCTPAVSEVYKNTITMRVIGATPTLALICSGSSKAGGTRKTSELTVGGDFLTGYNVADLCQQTDKTSFDANTEWGLYTRLKENYIVTPVNGYAVFNKLNYEPFDILLLTDYPKASKSDAAAAVLDDMADLCDYRPMLSFKAHMVAKSPSKWAAKGFTTSPVVTKGDGKLNLNIVCYAHPMFASLKTGDDVYTDVGNTSAPLVYTMLSGTGYEGSKGMQGFELAAAENFITIGLTHYNATITKDSPNDGEVEWTPGTEDRMLVTVAERQANPEARFILFSLNIGAHSKLTEKGEDVVLACLNYLLGTAEGTIEPADCSFTFDNGENNEHDASWYASNCPSCTGTKGDGKWTTAANWGPDYRLLPGEFTSVRIKKPVEVNDEHAHVMEVRVIDEGSIDIPANKALDVKSTIRRMDGSEIYPTEENDIHVGSASTGNGTLIFNNDEGDTKARVDMYSKGYIDGEGVKNYQYIGTPFVEINALYNYYGSWIYSWGTKKNGNLGWVVVKNGGPMTAWTGYCITQEAPTYHQMSGTLTATGTVDITVPANANMVVGNSWTAPIDINALTTDDLEGLTANIYFFNTGVDKTGGGTTTENATGDARWTGGTYVSVPIHTAPYTGDDHIPSLQGFFVKSNGSAGTLHLDYDRHVRKTTRDNILSGELHAPARRTALSSDEPVVLKMKVSGENYDDKLLLLEREDFTEGFDNGWDGDKWDGNESALYIYTTDNNGTENSVSAIPELEGTVIGFRAGEDDAYTLNFEYLNSDEPLYLYDVENNTYTQIMTGMTYRFFTTDNEKHARFIITRSNGQEVATGVEPVSGSLDRSKAKKLLIEDKMFIMVNGMLYDATGKVVK